MSRKLSKIDKLFVWSLGIEILLIITVMTVAPEVGYLGIVGIIFTSVFLLVSAIIMRANGADGK